MNATEYARKRDAGLCAWNATCQSPATHGTLCGPHRVMARAATSAANARRYFEKKAAGICVWRGCKTEARPDCVHCTEHSDAVAERHKAYYARPDVKEHSLETARKYRRKRARKGMCVRCSKPRVTALYCPEHRDDNKARWHAKKAGKRVAWRHCSRCGEGGHDVRICRQTAAIDRALAPLPPLRIEDFALARTEAA